MLLLSCFHGIEHGYVAQGAVTAGPLGCMQSSLCFFLPFIWIFYHIFAACTGGVLFMPVCGVRTCLQG